MCNLLVEVGEVLIQTSQVYLRLTMVDGGQESLTRLLILMVMVLPMVVPRQTIVAPVMQMSLTTA